MLPLRFQGQNRLGLHEHCRNEIRDDQRPDTEKTSSTRAMTRIQNTGKSKYSARPLHAQYGAIAQTIKDGALPISKG